MENKNNIPTPNFDQINPITCVNGKVRKLHRLINSAYAKRFRPFGLKGSMVSMLFIIGKKKGISQRMLAEALILDQSTVSRDIKRFQQKGWVITSKGEDSRQSELSLTDSGYLLLEEVSPIWHDIHQKIEALIGSYNIQHIDNITQAIKSNINDL